MRKPSPKLCPESFHPVVESYPRSALDELIKNVKPI